MKDNGIVIVTMDNGQSIKKMTTEESIAFIHGYQHALEQLHDRSLDMHDIIAEHYEWSEQELAKLLKCDKSK